ncbi:MAG: hypothetical protein CSA66_04930 [Proteobacteria bacterium]|nr:MAG: hypothetical protein CSA66_04930 [Pseudomonadota bacterium]
MIAKDACEEVDTMTEPSKPMTVAAIMSRDLATLTAGDTLDLAGTLMSAARIRHLPVVDAAGRLVGLVTHRDLLGATVSLSSDMSAKERMRFLGKVPIDRIMQSDVKTVRADTPIVAAAHLILEHKYGCLPVVDANGRLDGLVTEHDFVMLAVRMLDRGSASAPKGLGA